MLTHLEGFAALPPTVPGEFEARARVPGVTTEDDRDEFGLTIIRFSSAGGTEVSYSAEFHVDLCDMKCWIPLNRRDLLALIGMLLRGVSVIHRDERRRRSALATT